MTDEPHNTNLDSVSQFTEGAIVMDSLTSTLGKNLFWDADYTQLDLDIHAAYIIPRVMDYGCWEDVQFVFTYYERERIRDILSASPSLQIRTIYFFAQLFALPLESFAAYHNRQRNNWNR